MCSTKDNRVREINLINFFFKYLYFLDLRNCIRTSYFLDWIYNNWVIEKPLATGSLSALDSPTSISAYMIQQLLITVKYFFITDTENTFLKPILTRRCRDCQFKA